MAFRLVQARHFAVRMDYGQGKYVFAHPAWGFATTYEFSHPLHRSYSMNLGDNEIAPTANKIPAYSIESGSGTVYLCELHDERNLLGKPDLAALSGKEFTSMIFDAKKAPCHGTLKAPRVNILFFDGHVEVMDEATARKGEVFSYKKP
jgi:prepilin-type processing-associated H-X9-DG protein